MTPGRYVDIPPQEDDGEPFEEKMTRLAARWRQQQAESAKLDAEIAANLESLGFGPTEEELGPTDTEGDGKLGPTKEEPTDTEGGMGT